MRRETPLIERMIHTTYHMAFTHLRSFYRRLLVISCDRVKKRNQATGDLGS